MVADTLDGCIHTILGLGSVHYPITMIVVARIPEHQERIAGLLYRYRCTLPHFFLFKSDEELSIAAAMNAGLQEVKTQQFCVLRGDLLHMLSFERVIPEMCEHACACLSARKYFANSAGWAIAGKQHKPFWNTAAVRAAGAFQKVNDNTVFATEYALAQQLGAEQQRAIDEVLFFGGSE